MDFDAAALLKLGLMDLDAAALLNVGLMDLDAAALLKVGLIDLDPAALLNAGLIALGAAAALLNTGVSFLGGGGGGKVLPPAKAHKGEKISTIHSPKFLTGGNFVGINRPITTSPYM